jgi:hypothetical protein
VGTAARITSEAVVVMTWMRRSDKNGCAHILDVIARTAPEVIAQLTTTGNLSCILTWMHRSETGAGRMTLNDLAPGRNAANCGVALPAVCARGTNGGVKTDARWMVRGITAKVRAGSPSRATEKFAEMESRSLNIV